MLLRTIAHPAAVAVQNARLFQAPDRELAQRIRVLRQREAELESAWAALEPGAVVEGLVTGMNKGGLEVEMAEEDAERIARAADRYRRDRET